MSTAEDAIAAGFAVRPITLDDVAEVAVLHVRIWREAYAGLMPDAYLADLDPEEFAASRRDRMAAGIPVGGVDLVALDPAGEIAGFGVAGPGRDEDRPGDWELFAINTLRSAQGTGLAHLMIATLVGERSAYLWVLPENARARAFYARHGFRPDGVSKPFPLTGLTEIRLIRPATARR